MVNVGKYTYTLLVKFIYSTKMGRFTWIGRTGIPMMDFGSQGLSKISSLKFVE